jgi:serine protease AprX
MVFALPFLVNGQPAALTEPGQGALNDPAAGQDLKGSPIVVVRPVWDDLGSSQREHCGGAMYRSISTVNADAAQRLFGATGRGIVWAVLASGIDATHPHFRRHGNLDLPGGLQHMDFTATDGGAPLADKSGFGTGVAGVIAGGMTNNDGRIVGTSRARDETGETHDEQSDLETIAGMAPECKLLSMKVLDDTGNGQVSTVIAALQAIQELNGYGQQLRVHGVNLSLAYAFDPQWYACGLSPLCIEVDRLVRSGVVVVAAAGNAGYGYQRAMVTGSKATGMAVTIDDPGNAERAITVGATHRDMPQVYGVSWFSAKGPTLDGRMKPDLVAPGDRIMTCATGKFARAEEDSAVARYREDSGTSLAAAHVSGLAAAFLSVRRDLIGRPDDVKQYLLASAIDLGRTVEFQGRGLVNLLGALELQSVPAARPPVIVTPSAAPAVGGPAVATDTGHRVLRVMCSYSHKDEVLWDELRAHLAPLRRQGLIELWYDRMIRPGMQWGSVIARELQEADVILLLVSAYFIDSDYAYEIEMQRAIERHKARQAHVVPIIVRPADWSATPFAEIQALPKDAKPVTSWDDQQEAWADVAKGLRALVEMDRS